MLTRCAFFSSYPLYFTVSFPLSFYDALQALDYIFHPTTLSTCTPLQLYLTITFYLYAYPGIHKVLCFDSLSLMNPYY